MQKLSNVKLISIATTLLTLLLITKVISLVIWWYLPSEGVELNAKNSYQPKYQRVSFENMLPVKKSIATPIQESVTAMNIDNLILKGLYGNHHSGFVIISKKSNKNETAIVAVGESYEGYKLVAIELNEVIFTRNAKEYKLSLAELDTKVLASVQEVEPVDDGESVQKEVSRADINNYSKNPALIWKDIGIKEIMDGKQLKGFRVTRVKKGSKMATLGLQKGDVIIKANNVLFTSLNDVFNLYKDIDKIQTLALTIQRNNQEKEIIYEIH
ncbi:MAG: PDZ domain-containing protein [Campylobacterales bacterium]|nr:PDZ domain-containing protein [Campylobacterales bacterium]